MIPQRVRSRLTLPWIAISCLIWATAGVRAGHEVVARQPEDLTRRRIVYRIPGMDRVAVIRDRTYRVVGGESLGADIYSPPGLAAGARLPAVILIHGGPIPADMVPQWWGAYRSYGELIAASGLVAVTFKHRFYGVDRFEDAADDVEKLLEYVRSHAKELRIDPDRLAVWAFSAGGPLLSPAFRDPPPYIRCIVSYYAPLDLRHVPAGFFGAAIPGATVDRLSPLKWASKAPGSLPPILLARAGRDFPWINESVDEFVRVALAKGITLDLMTHPRGQHAFDVLDDDERSREIIRRTISFLREHLSDNRE